MPRSALTVHFIPLKVHGVNISKGELSPTELARLADELVARMMEISRRVSREVGQTAGSELTPPQFLIMRNLIEGSGDCMSELADLGHMPRSAVTAMVDRLEARGFVERVRDGADRRIVHVRATREGIAEYRKVRYAIRKQVILLLASLEPAEIATLAAVFERLTAAAPAGADEDQATAREDGAR